MPSTIGKCKLFRIKHVTLLEGETFLRNKHDIAFFEIKCTFFGRKENTISFCSNPVIATIFILESSVIDEKELGNSFPFSLRSAAGAKFI